MTVDSLDGYEGLGLRDSRGGPRSVGWAISRSDFHTSSGPDRRQPPYVESQLNDPYIASQYIASQWDSIRYRNCSSAG